VLWTRPFHRRTSSAEDSCSAPVLSKCRTFVTAGGKEERYCWLEQATFWLQHNSKLKFTQPTTTSTHITVFTSKLAATHTNRSQHLKPEVLVNKIYKLIFYLKEKFLHLHHKNIHSVYTKYCYSDSKNNIKCVNTTCKIRSFCNVTEDGNAVYVVDWLSP